MHASHIAHQQTIPFAVTHSIRAGAAAPSEKVLVLRRHDGTTLQPIQRQHQLFWNCSRTVCRCGTADARLTASQSPSDGSIPDFELIKIPGNGSCMFQALAQGHHLLTHRQLLSENELNMAGFSLRRAICFLLEKHREDIEPFVLGDYSAYISYMATEGVWGGEPELAMAVRSIQRPILVYNTTKSGIFGSKLRKAAEYGTDSFTNVPPVCLLFYGHHYDLLRAKA